MNINFFFISLIAGLIGIFIYFKPLYIKEQVFIDVPLFELNNFVLYELDNYGLTTLMSGESTVKYSNRYEVHAINYTDNSKKYMANMQSDYGIYKDNDIILNGNIKFVREDGFTFETDKAKYNKLNNLITTDGKYTSFREKNSIVGSSLEFNNKLNRIKSSNVTVTYQLEESF
jgi:LPS export ABC transporter protein LptC